MTCSKDGEKGAWRTGLVSVMGKGVVEVSRSRTKAGSDENDEDGRDSHPHPSIVVIRRRASRLWSVSSCRCGGESSAGCYLSNDNVRYMLDSGHFEYVRVGFGEFAAQGSATWGLMIWQDC